MVKDRYTQLRNWLGTKIYGVGFNIDLMNACPLHCPSCAVGSIGGRTGRPMSFDLFRRIMDKAQSECKVRYVQLYAFSDPCAHRDLDMFVMELTRRGIESRLSTVLQTTKCDFARVIEARPSEFRISFPGWKKMHIYQAGAKPELFDRQFAELMKLPRYPETKWTMAYHVYKDNRDEVPKARWLAHENDILFVALPAIFMVNERFVEKRYTEADKELIGHLLHTPEEAIEMMDVDTSYCLVWKQVYIDALGMVYLCQLVYEDQFQIACFLDTPLKELRKRIREHPFCDKCLKAGGHTYQYCFADFVKYDDPVQRANQARRKR